jgi:hypothetical protein
MLPILEIKLEYEQYLFEKAEVTWEFFKYVEQYKLNDLR